MAVVVEQTLPFSAKSLGLENPTRWNSLLPLLRPSVKSFGSSNILVDTAQAGYQFVHIAAVGSLGNFSSKILDDKHVTAIVSGAGEVSVADIVHAIHTAGGAKEQGVVVVRVAKKRDIRVHDTEAVVEVDAEGNLEADHLLHLLGNVSGSCRTSLQQVVDLLKLFVKRARTVTSKFHAEKADGNPAVLHADGARAYTMAKQAVEKDLKTVLAKAGGATGDVFSVHYSDVNGLSRLENYILAKEIAEFFVSQALPYHISHSTILNHAEQARGFGISVVPLSSAYLAAQTPPKHHEATPSQIHTSEHSSFSPTKSQIAFNDSEVRRRIEAGCAAVIKEEPTITRYDEIVGDGDCGYTLRDGAKQVLAFISGKDLARLPETVGALVHDLEVNMGGTSGALYCIFLTALSQSLATEKSVPAALQGALQQLLKYTRARLGDRTMMDALIPFIDTLGSTRDVGPAIQEAEKGVEGTKKMEAKLGRSTYLDESATAGTPDPGAYGLLVLLKGMAMA